MTTIRIVISTNNDDVEEEVAINKLKDRLEESNICYTIVREDSPCINTILKHIGYVELPILISGDGKYFAEHIKYSKVDCIIEYENNSIINPFCDKV